MKSKIKITVGFFFIVFLLSLQLLIPDSWLSLELLKKSRDVLEGFVQAHYLGSCLIFAGMYFVVAALGLPFAALLSIASGFLFGPLIGTFLVVCSATLGASILFLITRYLLGEVLQHRYRKSLGSLNKHLDVYGINYFLFVRLVALFPFFLINILAGLTNVSLFSFIWTTAVGIIPGAFIFVYAGGQLGEITTIRDVFSSSTLLAFFLLGLLPLLSLVIKKLFFKQQNVGAQ